MIGAKILVVDDEKEIRKLIKSYLLLEQMEVDEVGSYQDAYNLIMNKHYDLIVLDIMLPDQDGFELIKKLRGIKNLTPIILLSARREDTDKVLGLGLGADDYVVKPFSPQELMARIKAHIRRNNAILSEEEETLEAGIFLLNLSDYTFYKDKQLISLSPMEMKLMRFFMENPNKVFTKVQLYNNVWGMNDYTAAGYDDNSVMVYISHLREKIEDDMKAPEYIKTVWGIGYKFIPGRRPIL